MRDFQLGDIVRIKRFSDRVYYMVTDVADFSVEGDEQPDIECELIRIFPVSAITHVEMLDQNELALVAGKEDKEHDIILNFIRKERSMRGIHGEPDWETRIKLTNTPAYQEEVNGYKEVTPPVVVKKVTANDIKRIVEDDTTDKQIEIYVERMDTHLTLLHIAIKNNQPQEIELQKSKLKEVRNKLMELEYFQMAQRRNGTSINIK
jgi:hypothetical protein